MQTVWSLAVQYYGLNRLILEIRALTAVDKSFVHLLSDNVKM